MTAIQIEEKGAVCHARLVQPRINVQMLKELEDLCIYLEDESPSSIVVFRGHGGIFTKGIDLSDFSKQKPPDIHGFNKWERAVVGIERLKKVTFAAIEGECASGGVQIALACDFRIATADAVLALDEVKRGFLPGLATWRLPKYVGLGVAKHLVLTGRPLPAAEAERIGLVNRVCAAERLDAAIDAAVMEFLPVHGHVVALARRLLNESYAGDHENFLGSFLAAQHKAITTDPFIRVLQNALK